jgi:hypothetical protein
MNMGPSLSLSLVSRACLCPWDNGQCEQLAPPPIHKNLQKEKCKALQYCDSN